MSYPWCLFHTTLMKIKFRNLFTSFRCQNLQSPSRLKYLFGVQQISKNTPTTLSNYLNSISRKGVYNLCSRFQTLTCHSNFTSLPCVSHLPKVTNSRRYYHTLQSSQYLVCSQTVLKEKLYSDNSASKITKENESHLQEYKENIFTVPNLLTTSRIVSVPVLGYLISGQSFEWALGLFVFAGFTDLLDGQIARTYPSQRTALGTHLDPLADKLLISVLTVALTVVHLIPVWLTALIVSRDVALIGAAFYIRYVSLSQPKTLSRFFDLTKASAKLYPSTLSKVNTALQLALVAFTLAAPVFNYVNHPALQALWYITACTTLTSGWFYMRSGWSHVKILNKS